MLKSTFQKIRKHLLIHIKIFIAFLIFIVVNVGSYFVFENIHLNLASEKFYPTNENVIITVNPNSVSKLIITNPTGETFIGSKEKWQKHFNSKEASFLCEITSKLENLTFIDKMKYEPDLEYDYNQAYLIEINTYDGLIIEIDAFAYKTGYWLKLNLVAKPNASETIKYFVNNSKNKYQSWIYRIPVKTAQIFIKK